MLEEKEIFETAKELYEDFQSGTTLNKNIELADALNVAYEFNNFCEAIMTLNATGGNKFISPETWEKFYREFSDLWEEASTFIENNDWN